MLAESVLNAAPDLQHKLLWNDSNKGNPWNFLELLFFIITLEQLLLKTYPKVIHWVFDTEVLPALDSVVIKTLHPPSNFMKLDGMWGWGGMFH